MKARVLLLTLLLAVPARARADDVMVLLQQGSCPNCRLADADLVHVDLRDADLQGAQLQRANLSQAQLDGADLSKTNLKFTNLRGASLRGADLRGSQLYGTDLRQTNLSGAQLDEGALEQAHWEGAIGIKKGVHSHADLHNALLPMAGLIPTTHQARVIYCNQHRLDINQPSPSQAQCCELRQLTKSRQWHTTLPTALMLSTMSRLNHSLSETFKGATSSS